MGEILLQINCPHCQSSKIVKNGKKKSGAQHLLCRSCGKQFLSAYQNKGSDPNIKRLVGRLLERNQGIRDIAHVLEISRRSVLKVLCPKGGALTITPRRGHYRSLQLAEGWS